MAKKKTARFKTSRSANRPGKPKISIHLPSWTCDLAALLGFVLMVSIFFWPVLTGRSFFWEDFLEVFYPIQSYVAGELQAGRFPFWVPYVFGGTPLFAMIDSMVLYPPNWILALFVENEYLSYVVVEFHAIGHVLLSGTGVYFLCRELGAQRPGAFIAGTVALFSGRLIHQMFNVSMLYPYSWAPWCMLFMFRAIERKSWKAASIGGILLSLTIFGGHIQLAMYIFYSIGILFSILLISKLREANRPFALGTHLVGLYGLMNLIAVGLTAVVLIPTSELVDYSLRSDFSYGAATTYSFHPRQIITMIMPEFFGKVDPTTMSYWGPKVREYGRYWETYHYMGILPLFLTGIALFIRRNKTSLAFGVLAFICYVLAFGSEFPLYRLLFEYLPGFQNFRVPSRTFFIFSLAVAVLAGLGADTLWLYAKDRTHRHRFKSYLVSISGLFVTGLLMFAVAGETISQWLAGSPDRAWMAHTAFQQESGRAAILMIISILFLAAWYHTWIHRSILIGIGALLIYVDLYQMGYDFNLSSRQPVPYYATDQIIPFLKERQKEEGGRAILRREKSLMGPRNVGLLHRVRTFSGYTSPLRLKENMPPAYSWQLMNVRYYNDYITDKFSMINNIGYLKQYKEPMPQAFIVRDFVIAKNREEATTAMTSPTFNYHTMITLTEAPYIDISADSIRSDEMPKVMRNDPNKIDIKVSLQKPGILVLGEVYYPAWVAYVNGARQKVMRANDTMRAVPLPAGMHTIEIRYESDPFRLGGMIALFTLAVALGAIFLDRRY